MYVVVGPSGRTGRVVVRSLLERDLPVRVVVRTPDRAPPGVEVAVADLRDAEALTRAFAGARGAYVLVPDALHEPRFAAYQDAVATAIAHAAADLPHGVLLSALDCDQPHRGPPSGLFRAERRLGDHWAFLRAGALLDQIVSVPTLQQGFIGTFYPPSLPVPMIAAHEVGRAAADLLVAGTTGIVELPGSPTTMNHVAAALSRILGRPIRVEQAPLEAVVPIFTSHGASEDAALHLREMFAAVIRGPVRSGPPPASLEATLRTVLGVLA